MRGGDASPVAPDVGGGVPGAPEAGSGGVPRPLVGADAAAGAAAGGGVSPKSSALIIPLASNLALSLGGSLASFSISAFLASADEVDAELVEGASLPAFFDTLIDSGLLPKRPSSFGSADFDACVDLAAAPAATRAAASRMALALISATL